jgi:DNA-binding LytR/AlgR family response regulator
VAVFYIDNEDTFLITLDNNKYTIKKSLDELEQIAGSGFYRANRQYLINRKAIKDTSQYFARKLAVNLNVPLDDKITISKNKVSEFLNWLTIS